MISKVKRTIKRKYTQWKSSKNPSLHLEEIPIKGENIRIQAPCKINNPSGIQLGSNVQIRSSCLLSSDGGICIQDNVILEKGVQLLSNSSLKAYQPIIIGANSTIGANSIIYPGVKIAKGSRIPSKSIIKLNTRNTGEFDEEINRSSLFTNMNLPGNLVFVVSTGRSGSKAIASLLNQHSEVHAIHDSYLQFGRYAVDKLYGQIKSSELRQTLHDTFDGLSYINKPNHVQSDQKLGALISELAQIFPKAKFVWLIRNLEEFVNSAYPRGWFDNSEFSYPTNSLEFQRPKHKPAKYYAAYRVNGSKTGEVSETVWKSMTAFERNCWYWRFWNKLIEKQLKELESNRFITVNLKDLSSKLDHIQEFIGVAPEELEVKKYNQAFYKKLTTEDWNKEMKEISKKYTTDFGI